MEMARPRDEKAGYQERHSVAKDDEGQQKVMKLNFQASNGIISHRIGKDGEHWMERMERPAVNIR